MKKSINCQYCISIPYILVLGQLANVADVFGVEVGLVLLRQQLDVVRDHDRPAMEGLSIDYRLGIDCRSMIIVDSFIS